MYFRCPAKLCGVIFIMKVKYFFIDYTKAFGILLIVLGHFPHFFPQSLKKPAQNA